MNYGVFFGQNAVDQTAAEYDGWAGLLSGCVNDARDLALMWAALGYESRAVFSGWNIGRSGFIAADDWRITLDATRAAWRTAHTDLQSIVMPGDSVIIGNSGHGYTYDTWTQFGGGQGMCFADGLLRDTEFHDQMEAWPAGINVIYILDTCYSGGMDRGMPGAIKALPRDLRPTNQQERRALKSDDIRARVIQLCAALPTETACDGAINGAFTGSLLAVIDQATRAGDKLTWAQLMEHTRAVMTKWTQHPTLNVLGRGAELVNQQAI
jgi:metacaspase-1